VILQTLSDKGDKKVITVKRLRDLLAQIPDDGQVYGYESEDMGIGIHLADGRLIWIRARESDVEDTLVTGPYIGQDTTRTEP